MTKEEWLKELCPELGDWQIELIIDGIKEVIEAEREACARMCELLRPSKREYDHRFYDACTASAAVIRTRGEQ